MAIVDSKAAREDRLWQGHGLRRHYIGGQSYVVEKIGTADDFSDADGTAILNFAQAQDKARARMVRRVHVANGVAGPRPCKQPSKAILSFSKPTSRARLTRATVPRRTSTPRSAMSRSRRCRRTCCANGTLALSRCPARTTQPGKAQQYREFDGNEEAVRRRRSSANRVLTILKAALNHAFNDSKTASDVAWRKVKPFKAVDAARIRYLSISEATQLISACDREFRLLVQAALQTGCRYGELTRLEVQDFNPDAGTVAIRSSKSGKPRHVVLTDEGIALFTQLGVGRSSGELLLCRAKGEAWKASHQGRPMAEACERAE